LPREPPPQIRDRIPLSRSEPRLPSTLSEEPIEEESPEPSELLRRMEKRYEHLLEAKRKSTKIIVALCVILVLAPLIVGYGCYNVGISTSYEPGYAAGYEAGHLTGYDTGLQNGSILGYEQGYNGGLFEGNQTGYAIGHLSGNSSGYLAGRQSGFSDGYLQGVKDGAGRGYNVRDPTYQEMMSFIAADKTNLNTYHDPDYVCWNFASDVMNNAFKAGYRCGWVYIECADTAHAIVCFNTPDRGLIFIEPQKDQIVDLRVGGTLSWLGLPYTVENYAIVW
jgi:flagellar biosynthesis/type III secretory pathway protein FliH